MYKVNEYIMYKKDVCKLTEIKHNYYNGKDYYVLKPVSDPSLKNLVPIDNANIKELITKDEIKK